MRGLHATHLTSRGLALAIVLVGLATGTSYSQTRDRRSAPRVRAGTRSRPVYAGDERLAARIRLPTNATWVSLLLDEATKGTEIVLLAQPGIRAKTARILPRECSLRELMEQLAALFTAEWYLVGERYVLARNRQLAASAFSTREEAKRDALDSLRALENHLSPQQRVRLEEGQILRKQDLNVVQQGSFDRFAAALRCWSPFCDAAGVGPDELQLWLDRWPDAPPRLMLNVTLPRAYLSGFGIAYTQGRRP